ncbi:uncharacterized protein LOC116163910 [Photinus pyralis]|uniref:uncharacterized protein LOC116163910 n=1 Tax=Photinus pyralis TaxID=7054 RepID=UPI0012677C14|nr:uncharacterized protein LOC116163910 [Photinus pyralis]
MASRGKHLVSLCIDQREKLKTATVTSTSKANTASNNANLHQGNSNDPRNDFNLSEAKDTETDHLLGDSDLCVSAPTTSAAAVIPDGIYIINDNGYLDPVIDYIETEIDVDGIQIDGLQLPFDEIRTINQPCISSAEDNQNFNNGAETEVTSDNPTVNKVVPETPSDPIPEAQLEIDCGLTKTGNPRKRKKYLLSRTERNTIKKRKAMEGHNVKQSCPVTCKVKCSSIITPERRKEINKQYWCLPTTQEKKTFVLSSVSKKPVTRRTTCSPNSRRSFTNEYFLKNADGTSLRVCKTFFLATLGYEKNNDKILQSLSKQTTNISSSHDKRKGRIPANKVDHEVIVKHIESFEPSISHYRREHAPNRRYLPSDLTITKMHEDFVKKHQNFKCSYDLYRSEVSKLNISFVKLGHEQCERCEHFNLHEHNKENVQIENCETCKIYDSHIKNAGAARQDYKNDSAKLDYHLKSFLCWIDGTSNNDIPYLKVRFIYVTLVVNVPSSVFSLSLRLISCRKPTIPGSPVTFRFNVLSCTCPFSVAE